METKSNDRRGRDAQTGTGAGLDGDRLSRRDRLMLRMKQYSSTRESSKAQVRAMIRHGSVFANMLDCKSKRITVESLCAEVGTGGVGYEAWYIRMALGFFDESEARTKHGKSRLGDMTMHAAQVAAGMRDEVGNLLPLYNPLGSMRFDEAMEAGGALRKKGEAA